MLVEIQENKKLIQCYCVGVVKNDRGLLVHGTQKSTVF